MQDRPDADELLANLEHWLDAELGPTLGGAQRYQARVAAGVVRMLRRELTHEDAALDAEWRGLDALLGAAPRSAQRSEVRDTLRARNRELCARIRAGAYDAEPGGSAPGLPRTDRTALDSSRPDGNMGHDSNRAAEGRAALLTHLRTVLREKLRVTNPGWLPPDA